MAFNLVGKKLTIITPKEADEILLSKNNYEGQRPLKAAHLSTMINKMRKGDFLTGLIIYANRPDGSTVLVNGQHQLVSTVASDIPLDAVVYEYYCPTEDDLFNLFTQVDQGKSRTQPDIVRACKGTVSSSIRGIPYTALAKYGAAISMADKNYGKPIFTSRSISPHVRVASVRKHPDEAEFLHQYRNVGYLDKISVNLAMIVTYRIDKEWARLFWDCVADGKKLPESDCCFRLRERLLCSKRGASSAVATREIYTHCILHWNALITGTKVDEYDSRHTVALIEPAKPNMPRPSRLRIDMGVNSQLKPTLQ